MKIPNEKIEEIRNAVDIVEYIGGFIKLKKRGKNYLGLCPFHNEKTPSFNVSLDKQMYYCFGCQRGGNVFTFIMEYDNISYVEAVTVLAEKTGIPITKIENNVQESETEILYSVCTFAAKAFYYNLKTEEGKFAQDYFLKRGFSEKTITTFGLGYSLRGWESLIEKAKEEGLSLYNLEKVGLLKKRDDGSYYDVFRGRAMFPIFSPLGRVIAFGARKLYDDDPLAKYINSPETPIYQKSKTLYGLWQAKESIREKDFVILVEGYADVISVFQAGIKNVVASSGTALTTEQIQLLSRYTKNIIFLYDADSAGANAMMRGVDLILENGLDVRVVQLPEGNDPDSFVQKNGVNALHDAITRATTFLNFKARMLEREGKFSTPEGKAEAIRTLVQTIAKVKDPLRQAFFIKEIAEEYHIYESTLYSELEKWKKKDFTKASFQSNTSNTKKSPEIPQKNSSTTLPLEEKELLFVLLHSPQTMMPFVFRHLSVDEISHPQIQKIIQLLVDEFDNHGSFDSHQILTLLENDEEKKIFSEVLFSREHEDTRIQREVGAQERDGRIFEQALGAIKSIKKKKLEQDLQYNRVEIQNALLNGIDTIAFLKEQQQIIQKIRDVEKYSMKNLQ